MPIYEYHCLECGHQKDVLQKVADDPLVDCPDCGQPKFTKKISAPGFQLKGTGWYETDFKNKSADQPAGGAEPGKSSGSAKKETAAPASSSDSSGNSTASAA